MWRVALLSLLLAGCDFLESATAKIVVAGVVTATPAIELEGQFAVPSETIATVWVGERESATSTDEPRPIAGAEVALSFSDKRVTLEEQSERGLYLATSLEEPALAYSSTDYAFLARIGTDSVDYGGGVRAPTALSAAAVQLTPSPTEAVPGFPDVLRHPVGAALEVAWQEQFGRYGYVSVYRGRANDPAHPELVFDNRPKTALAWIQFIVDPKANVSIPAATFSTDGVYAVVVVAVEKGEVLRSTFVGSPLVAGTGAIQFLAVGEVSL